MSDVVISVENLSKSYRLGVIGSGTLTNDLKVWWAKRRGRPNPLAKIGQADHHNRDGETVWALRDVNFTVKQGEVLGIIGKNGAGKSTLLKILSRVTAPTSGEVKVKGRIASLLEVGTGFHPELTGRENIYLNGAILGMHRAEIDRKLDEIVDFAGVESYLDTPVKRYSSGMYVRLAFAVAAHLEPEILVVDEVLAVGDVEFQKKCLGKMGEVAKEGRTVLFVSHNLAAVEQLCSRAILFSKGHLTNLGNVDSVVRSYLSTSIEQNGATVEVLACNPSGSFKLRSVGLLDESGRSLPIAQCGQDLNLAILLQTTLDLPGITVSIGINNFYDMRIAVLHSTIAGYDFSVTPGIYSFICQIPHFALSAGNYTLDIKVLSYREVILWAPHIKELTVEEGDFYKTGRLPDPNWGGVCHLQQQWKVQNHEQY